MEIDVTEDKEMLARIARVIGWDGDAPFPHDLAERVQDLVAGRVWWKKAAEHNLGKWSEAVVERDKARAERDRLEAWASDVASFLAEVTEREPWRVLRAAERLIRGHWNFDGKDSGRLLQLAEELEAEASARSRRDNLIEQAARVLYESTEVIPWEDNTPGVHQRWLTTARALADAGLLAEVDQ